MAVSERIKAEAKRTIDGMQRFYEKFSDEPDDAEELEHRIARVEASMEGCNGLTQADKIQKTAENVFELTCAQERSYDSLRAELKRTREEHRKEFSDIKEQNAKDFKTLQSDLNKGLESVMRKIEDSGMDSSLAMRKGAIDGRHMLWAWISAHPIMTFNAFMAIIVLVFISGHFEMLAKMFGLASSAVGAK